MTLLEMKFLGGLNLCQDGRPFPELKTQKGQALLCYLAVTQKPASRSALAGLLWPDKLEADAYSNLRKVLVRLKPLSPYLAITRATLALNPAAPHTLDVAEFEANASVKNDLGRLERAVDLFQGDFLDGFYMADAPLFDEWALAQRARLRALALGVLETLIAHFAGQANYETALRHARRLLAFEPWHEETHREVMRLLALSGQRSAALIQYETCRGLLVRELGVAPASATVSLYEEIKRGALEGMAAVTGPASHPPPVPLYNLPAQTTAFVGRESELAALDAHLADPNVRLLTILGLGGMGKTRLALAAAAAQLDGEGPPPRFPHGVIFVSLARLETPDQLVPAMAEAVNLRFVAGSDPKAQLLAYLRQKAMLLVLDNFEHLRAQPGLVDEILSAGPRVKILLTSREKLNVQAEQQFPIGGLALPAPAGVALPPAAQPLSAYGAIQLFCDRARRARPDFALSADNHQAVLDICRLVQGMPLGIVLAAAWLDTFSPQEVAAEIRANLDFLETQMEDLPERQRSLRAAFNHAWRFLPEPERAVFQRLSIFRGGFTRSAAQTVTGASRRDLQGLINKSLLVVSPEGRYDVHELLRQFAAEKLAEIPEAEAGMRDRHSAYYCHFLSEWSEHWHTTRLLEALAAVTRESDNVQRAWQWALEHTDCLRLWPALESWGEYHRWRGLDADAEVVFRALVERVRHLASDRTVASPDLYRLWAMALTWQGRFTVNNLRALALYRAGLGLIVGPELAQHDVRRDKAAMLANLGDRHYSLDRQMARQFTEQSLELYQACDDPWGIATSFTNLGRLDWATGNYGLAQERIQASLVLHQARGDLGAESLSLDILAFIFQHLGQLDEAVRLRRQVLALCHQLGNRSALPHCMATLSFSLRWQGKFDEELQWADESLALYLELGQRGGEGYIRLAVSMALLFTGQYEPARREATLALTHVREDDDHGVEATVHWALGCLALVEPDYATARLAFAESRRLYEEVQDNYLGLALSGPGYTACCEGNCEQAQPHFLEALQFALALKDYPDLVVALPGVALYLIQAGETERAVEIWELALAQPFVANSKWHADVVGAPLAAAAATLSPDRRQAARERGRASQIWATADALVNELLEHKSVPA